MMGSRKCLLRWFRCPVCGSVLTAPRRRGSTHAGHIKTMWCFVCAARRDFVQIDSSRAR